MNIVRAVLTVFYASSLITHLVLAVPVPPGNNVDSSALMPYSETTSDTHMLQVFPRQPNGTSFSAELKNVGEMTERIKSHPVSTTAVKVKLRDFLWDVEISLRAANGRKEKYPRDAVYNALKELGNAILLNWKRSEARKQVVVHLMNCLMETKPSDRSVELPLQQDLDDLTHGMKAAEWQRLDRLFKILQDTLRIADSNSFLYDKLAVDEAVLRSRSAVEKWDNKTGKKPVIDSINGCLTLIWVDPAIFDRLDASTKNTVSSSGTATPRPASTQSYAELRMIGLLAHPDNLINALILPKIMELVPDDAYRENWRDWSSQLSLMEVELERLRSPDRKEALRQVSFSQKKLREKVHKLSLFVAPETTEPHSRSTAPSQSWEEQQMSELLADPENPVNALLLPSIMEMVPDDAYRANWKTWSFQLSLMEVELKDSRSPQKEEALRQLALSQEKLREKVCELSLFVHHTLVS